ncbi:MAG: hypothetical protein LBE82_13210, partial [Chitinophagaceae bacterium]|nr:hypothetical protein [Chitinophagaceae bacterium]
MISALITSFKKNKYLLIVAAWLFTISFVVSNYWAYNATINNVKHSFEEYIATQENEFNNLLKDSVSLQTLAGATTDKSSLNLEDKPSYVFMYKIDSLGNAKIVYWSTYAMQLHLAEIQREDGIFPVAYTTVFFELIKRTIALNGSKYIIACAIPIRWDFSSIEENQYLKTGFVNFPEIENQYQISNNKNAVQIYNGAGKALFGIMKKNSVNEPSSDPLSLILKILGIIFILIYINATIEILSEKKGIYYGLSFMIVVILALRLLSYYFPFPLNFKNYELFDPSIYASSDIHRSLGDLMINMLLFFWLLRYLKFNKNAIAESKFKINESPKITKIIGIASLILLPLCTFGFGRLVFSLVNSSRIPFNVVDFFKLNIYTVVGFFILCVMVINYYYITTMLWERAIRLNYNFQLRIGIVIAAGLLIVSILSSTKVHSYMTLTIWLVIYLLLLEYRKKELHYGLIQSPFFIYWIVFFAASVTLAVEYQNEMMDLKLQKAFAEELSMQNDEISSRLLNMSGIIFSTFFDEYNYTQMYDRKENKQMKDSLVRDQFSGFSSRFQMNIYTYDSTSKPLYNRDPVPYEKMESIIKDHSKPTNIPNVFYSENKYHGFTYLYKNEITAQKTGKLLGRVFIIIKPNEYAGESTLYWELFKDGRNQNLSGNTNYSYAVYDKNKLTTSANDYSFPDSLTHNNNIPSGDFLQIKNQLWYNSGNNKTIVIIKNESSFIETTTLFGYLLCSFFIVCVLFRGIEYIIQSRFKWKLIKQLPELNIRAQIYTNIVFVSLFCFIVIAFSTISFVIIQYNKTNEENMAKDTRVLAMEIDQALKNNISFPDSISFVSIKDMGIKSKIDKLILNFSEFNEFNINFYDSSGALTVSTYPEIYSKEIRSDLMNPVAYSALKYKHRTQFIQNEQIGTLPYMSVYVPLFNNKKQLGYLNIPYLHTQKKLEETISNFLLSIINLNAFIFLLGGGIAFWITKRITNSFVMIGNRMRDINLKNKNEEITWERNDEIGELVKEYNKMVHKLDESAKALAQSEREGAWQEMAQQVAHEIKNPLTPMKLSIQLLQRAIQQNDSNVKDLSKHVAETLVEQIEQLSTIASDFS